MFKACEKLLFGRYTQGDHNQQRGTDLDNCHIIPRILRDKTMGDELLNIHKDDE